jgi:hypothetical protein
VSIFELQNWETSPNKLTLVLRPHAKYYSNLYYSDANLGIYFHSKFYNTMKLIYSISFPEFGIHKNQTEDKTIYPQGTSNRWYQ